MSERCGQYGNPGAKDLWPVRRKAEMITSKGRGPQYERQSFLKFSADSQKNGQIVQFLPRGPVLRPGHEPVHGMLTVGPVRYGSLDREQSHVLFNILLIYS